jgi:hypothetical protein
MPSWFRRGDGMKISITLFAILLTGCSGNYRAALVPMDPPPVIKESLTTEPVSNPYKLPVVKESLTTEKGSRLLTPDADAPTWRKIVFWGTVGH